MSAPAQTACQPVPVATVDEIVEELLTAGYAVIGETTETKIVAERAVLGHRDLWRVITVERELHHLPEPTLLAWSATCSLRRPLASDSRFPKWDLQALHFTAGPIVDALEFGVWLGGISSVPIDRLEVAAIESQRPKPFDPEV